MKVVISGATGYIGSAVLAECLKQPSISSVIVLSRRSLEDLAKDPKIKVIVVNDFNNYDDHVIDEVRTADAALWCLGTYEGNETVDIEYPLTFINAINTRPKGSSHFRYVQLSGAFTEPPPKQGEKERHLWYYANGRRVRGLTEAKVLETTDESPESEFTVYLVKPGGILFKNNAILECILGKSVTVGMNALAPTMVNLAVHGNDRKIFSNRDIIEHAALLKAPSTS